MCSTHVTKYYLMEKTFGKNCKFYLEVWGKKGYSVKSELVWPREIKGDAHGRF